MSQMTTGMPTSSAMESTATMDALSVGEITGTSTLFVIASGHFCCVLASFLESYVVTSAPVQASSSHFNSKFNTAPKWDIE